MIKIILCGHYKISKSIIIIHLQKLRDFDSSLWFFCI